MKKLLDSKFLFILALSVIVLIILGVGAFYLFDDSEATFVKDGYILNPLSAKNEKYLFDRGTSYKENLSSMVVFNDTDKNEVSVFKDSFLHYMDSSMSFLKNGAILDLNSISGSDAVKFYNITSKSIIAKNGDGYVIESTNGNIDLRNFMGRISDKKYIVAGNLSAKIPGNEKDITGNYFEIAYNEEGVVTIENSEVKYQVTADGTYIYAGDVVIDLGNKKITKNGEDVMSITAITINGDENIEIIPKTEEKKDDDNQTGNNGNGDNGNGTGTDNGTGNQANDQREDIVYETLNVSIEETEIHSTSITVITKVINAREDDVLILRVTDLDSGKTIDRTYDVKDDQEIRVPMLSPGTKYLFSAVNERDGAKYAQKVLETTEFGIKLEQTYVMANEMGYVVTVDDESEIDDIDITLKKFDEGNNSYDDIHTYHLSQLVDDIKGEHVLPVFTDLESNTIYTVTLDGFVIDSIKREKIYNITNTSLTLKEAPTFDLNKTIEDDRFILSIENIQDKDSAIESYTYYIFDNENDEDSADFEFNPENAIKKIVKTTAEPVELKVGRDVLSNHNYLYMVSVEYYDNDKYVEYVKEGKVDLFIGSDPFVTIQRNEEEISYDRISAIITITDNSCLVAMKDRECFNDYENYPIVIDVKEKDAKGNLIKIDGYPQEFSDFAIIDNSLRKTLTVTGLHENGDYVITVSAKRKDKPEDGVKILKAGAVYENEISTKILPTFDVIWQDGVSDEVHPINGSMHLKARENDFSVSSEIALSLINKVVFKLYDGPYTKLPQPLLAVSGEYLASDYNITETFADGEFEITEKLFDIVDIEALRTLTKEKTGREDNKLSSFYTVEVEAYYMNGDKVSIEAPHQFQIAAYLTSDAKPPVISATEIYKQYNDGFSDLLTSGEGGTVVGYEFSVNYDYAKYAEASMTVTGGRIKIYNQDNQLVKIFTTDNVENPNNSRETLEITSDELNDPEFSPAIYLGYGVDNGTASAYMTRGKKYYAKVEIDYQTPESIGTQESEPYELLAKKQAPKISKLYVAETTKTGSITYKYTIQDIDNAWHSDGNEYKINYSIGDNVGSVPIVKNTELATFTFDGLSNGAAYTLRYLCDNYDTGSEEDTELVLIGSENRLYDGYYDANEARYNFKYRVISDPLHDNRVIVEILASDDILDKILIYHVKFTDEKGNIYEVPDTVWNLTKCDWASETDKNRCFEVPYTALTRIDPDNGMISSMKSDGDNKNYITVSIESMYDNGLMGFDYVKDEDSQVGENKPYPYMILQDDSTVQKLGKYIIVNNRGIYAVSSEGNRTMPLGYYYFKFANGGISYKSRYRIGDNANIASYTIDHRGYYLDGMGSLNPKMVSVKTMEGIDNTFYFSSITPMIKIDKKISLINGAKVMMTLSGADAADFCADNNQNTCDINGDKYLYIQVLDEDTLDTTNTGNIISEPLIPTIKVPLGSGNSINNQYTVDILNLLHNSQYYFKVYAYLNDGGTKKLTQVFDKEVKNKPETYSFNSKRLTGNNGILASVNATPQPIADPSYYGKEEVGYNDKELAVTIGLNDYDSEMNIRYNFTVSYNFCKTADCEEEGSKVFDKDIEETKKSMTSKEDITAYDLTYNQPYYLYLYMTYDYYDKTLGRVVSKTVPVYETSEEAVITTITSLEKPTFTVVREADYIADAGGYFVDVIVGIKDSDHVLTDGKYYVKLYSDNSLVGNLMLEDEDGIFRQVGESAAYGEYYFNASEANKRIRISGLSPNTNYKVVVSGNVHMKNSELTEYDFEVRSGKEGEGDIVWTTNEYGIAFGAVTYRAIKKGFIVRYGAGSNVDALHIQAIEVDVKENGREFYNRTIELGEDNKYLEAEKETGKYRFIIEYDEPDKENSPAPTYYTVMTRYKIEDPTTHEIIWLGKTTGRYYEALEQNVSYDPNEIIDENE